jgi:methionyl-tRNA formyltransferase
LASLGQVIEQANSGALYEMDGTQQQSASKSAHDKIRVLFFGRNKCNATEKAFSHLERLGFDTKFVESKDRGDILPESVGHWDGDYIFCFRSLFVLPKNLIEKARIAAINFHPAPTEYPGSGCLNFALYDDAKYYGVTAHLMNEKIDNGRILDCRRFPILKFDGVDSLLKRTHLKLLDLFYDVTTGIGMNGEKYIQKMLSESADEKWNGEARKMHELNELKTIRSDATKEEVERVVRATYTELFPPKIILHGFEFFLKDPNRN